MATLSSIIGGSFVGNTGAQGTQGVSGTNGNNGAQGIQGIQGIQGGSVTVSDDNTTNATRYILFEDITSGTLTTTNVSSSKLTFNPSTGQVTAVDFNSTSDKNLKENIEVIENSIEILSSVNPVKFTWKETGQISYGVIAQEIEKILPELVKQDGEYKSVSYIPLIAFLIDALKKHEEEIQKLKNK